MKNILITGSTDGIGKLAALKFAKEGHEIYLHGRSSEKLERVISEIKSKSNNDKIKELGWSPVIPLDETLERIINWYRQN